MVQKRDIVMCIILSVVTCGFYGIYWYYKLAEEVNIVTNTENEASGGMVVLLTIITCGIYGFFWAYHAGERLARTKKARGIHGSGSEAVLYLVLYIFIGLGAYAFIQNDINLLVEN